MGQMSEKDARAIDELLNGGYSLTDFEKKVLTEWKEKGYSLSFNQRNKILNPCIVKYLEGGDPKKYDAPMQIGDIQVKRTEQGYYLCVGDTICGRSIAKSEAQLILDWLATALEDLRGSSGSAEEPDRVIEADAVVTDAEEEEVIEDDEDNPF